MSGYLGALCRHIKRGVPKTVENGKVLNFAAIVASTIKKEVFMNRSFESSTVNLDTDSRGQAG